MRPKFKNIGRTLVISLFLISPACQTKESRPPYDSFENTLSMGGETIQWSRNDGFLNIVTIENNLSGKNLFIFSKSLEWYATESDLNPEYLSGKTAKQVVDIVNCIKKNEPESQRSCVDRRQ